MEQDWMQTILRAYGRALRLQLRPKTLLLALLPFVAALVLWGVLLAFTLQPLIDLVQDSFTEYGWFRQAGSVLGALGLGALKTIIVPLLAMWLLLPAMILTALLFVGVAAMPAAVRAGAQRYFPQLERRDGGSFLGGLWVALSSFVLFALLWLAALPLYAVAPLALAVHAALFAWLTARVMAYDALSAHASPEERRALMRLHRWPLLAMGLAAGLLGAVPTMLWLSGPLAVLLFPLVAAVAILLYVLVFHFTALWFACYCLDALTALRTSPEAAWQSA
jgi:hypothetical protein